MKRIILTLTLVFFAIPLHSQTFQDFLNRVYAAPDSERAAIVDSFSNAVPQFPLIEFDTLCHFLYRGTATSVTVPGDANQWSAGGFPMTRISTTNLWYRSQVFETDARLDYKFVLNGSTWILDPRNPNQVSGGFGPNSELRMPAYIPPPEIGYYPGIPHGTLRDTLFTSANLGNARTVRVYLPPGYEASSDSYAVILFHDGLEYVTLAKTNNVFDYLLAQNRIQPVIGVFVPPVNRTAEYAGNQMTQFTAFIVSELMPYIDGRYRTRRNPAGRAVMGASNGGNISLWIAYNHPEVFGNVGAQSSNIIASIFSGFLNSPTLPLKLYLDLGTYDIPQLIPLVRNFIPILQSKGYVYRYEEYHDGHSWGNWRAHVDNALELFFPGPAVSVGDAGIFPPEFNLFQNYPNPFNPSTTLTFHLGHQSPSRLVVYDILGREITTLLDEILPAGAHSVRWNAEDTPSGIYIARLQSGQSRLAIKLLLVK